MEFSIVLLFIIASVIVIYFSWNFYNNYKRPQHSKHEPDIRYYELKSKYEFLVAVVSLVTAVAVFYGLGTKKEIEQSIKSELETRLEPTRARVLKTELKVDSVNKNLKDAENIISSYYSALKQIESKQKSIDIISQKSQDKFKEFANRIDILNSKNILKRNFYLVDNIKLNYTKLSMSENHSEKIKFDTLLTTLGDKLPRFKKEPIIIPVSDMGFGLHIFNVTTTSFEILVAPEYFNEPKDGLVGVRLLITEVE